MRGLPAAHYTSAEIFEREREKIFGRLWLFAGLRSMVARSGAYYARTLAGVPIVLQNLDGEIACFLNSCAHRNAQVQPEGFGVRGFVCGYHGFRYAIDGSVANIPMHDQHYRFDPEERRCLRLRRFALEQIGQFLFVCFAEKPLPIAQQFSQDLRADLESLSAYFDSDVIYSTCTSRYNWKLPGENLRDLLHPRFVHPQTLFPFFDFEASASNARPPRGTPQLLDVSFGGAEGRAKTDQRWPYWDQLEAWPAAHSDQYYNWLLFPNLHVASPDGCRTFGIEQYEPIDASTTQLVHFMFTAKRRDTIAHGDAILRGMLRGARTVLDEDARVMASVQRAFTTWSPTQQHGAFEQDINRFAAMTKVCLDAD